MGRERNRPGKHLYLCLTCVVILSLATGCATPEKNMKTVDNQEKSTTRWRLLTPDELRDEKALLSAARKSRGDQILFDVAIEHALAGNYSKSLTFLKQLAREYPMSPWATRAKPVADLIQETMKLKRHYSDALQENARLQKQSAEVTQENGRLKQVIEESKKVDIEIQERKRELVR